MKASIHITDVFRTFGAGGIEVRAVGHLLIDGRVSGDVEFDTQGNVKSWNIRVEMQNPSLKGYLSGLVCKQRAFDSYAVSDALKNFKLSLDELALIGTGDTREIDISGRVAPAKASPWMDAIFTARFTLTPRKERARKHTDPFAAYVRIQPGPVVDETRQAWALIATRGYRIGEVRAALDRGERPVCAVPAKIDMRLEREADGVKLPREAARSIVSTVMGRLEIETWDMTK